MNLQCRFYFTCDCREPSLFPGFATLSGTIIAHSASPNGATVNSLGRNPLVAANAWQPSPNGAKEPSPGTCLSPRWGLYPLPHFVQGLTPLAINDRPVGAWSNNRRNNIVIIRDGRVKGPGAPSQ